MGVKKMACFGLKLSQDYFGELGGTPVPRILRGTPDTPTPSHTESFDCNTCLQEKSDKEENLFDVLEIIYFFYL